MEKDINSNDDQQTTTNNEMSFLEESSGPKIHIKDILIILQRNLIWLVLCSMIGAMIGNFKGRKETRIYSSVASIVLKDSSTSTNSSLREANVRRDLFKDPLLYSSSIENEIKMLCSMTTMQKVTQNLKLNIEYTQYTQVVKRTKNLYGESPIEVDFIDLGDNDYADFLFTPKNILEGIITINEEVTIPVKYDDTVQLPLGRIVIHKTWFYSRACYNSTIKISHHSLWNIASHYCNAISVDYADAGSLFNVSLRDPSPKRCADVINETVKVYNEDAINDKKRIVAYTYDYINDRLQTLHSDLGIQESELASFKSDNELLNISDLGQNFVSTSIETSEEVSKLRRCLSAARYLMHFNENNTKNTLIPPSFELDDENINNVISQFNEDVLKLEKYKSENNPIVKNLQTEQNVLKQSLAKLLDVYTKSIENRIAEAQKISADAKKEMKKVPQKQIYIENIERLQKIQEALYMQLLSKREEILISQPAIEGNAKIIDPAQPNYSPISPNTRKNTLTGLLIGLCIPFAVFFLRLILDTRVHNSFDISKKVTAPLLIEIPQREKKDKRDIVVENKKKDAISESFRMLRSKIDFLGDTNQEGARVIMITSMLSSSGKTFVASNLAACLGIAGKKVLLMDMDLRKGTMTHKFYSRRNIGMSHYLTGKTDDIDELIHHDTIAPSIDCIFSGRIPPNPAELLDNERFANLMNTLRSRYEFIILDSVPINVVDATIIRHYVDNTFFIIRAQRFDKRMLPEVEGIYRDKVFPNLAVIINSVKFAKAKKRFGYGYGYGYGYGANSTYGDDEKLSSEETTN